MTVTSTRDLPAVTTLLFDLDGTLLDIDMPAFLRAYYSLAARRFVRPYRLPRVTPVLAAASLKMLEYRAGAHTLDRVFLEAVSPALKRTPQDVRDVLAAFHGGEYEQLSRFVVPRPAARPLLEKARALGYDLVVATNPVFFRDAIGARLRWAGLEGIPFKLITSAELMRAAKPHQPYFARTLSLVGRRADECLMIGDDPDMDLPAGRLGIGTWLAIPEPEEAQVVPGADLRGTLEELGDWLDAREQDGSRGLPTSGPVARRADSPPSSAFQAVQELMLEIDVDYSQESGAGREESETLRSRMQAGSMTPRNGVWLWIRIMRWLDERHAENIVYGCISPDAIVVDGDSAIRIDKPASCHDVYIAPEVRAGRPPDFPADIYSMGVLLFELVIGSPEFAGTKRPAELRDDLPPWLDELIQRCIEPDPGKRHRSTGEISAALVELKGGMSFRI